ncbi:CCNYL1 protein [Pelomyxa schiedti]|nr:CCNYL1 protein [Pelomyxa schiedti]
MNDSFGCTATIATEDPDKNTDTKKHDDSDDDSDFDSSDDDKPDPALEESRPLVKPPSAAVTKKKIVAAPPPKRALITSPTSTAASRPKITTRTASRLQDQVSVANEGDIGDGDPKPSASAGVVCESAAAIDTSASSGCETTSESTDGTSEAPSTPTVKIANFHNRRIAELVAGERKHMNNSTSSLYIRTELSHPNLMELLRCMCQALRYVMETTLASDSEHVIYSIFSESKHPITTLSPNVIDLPSCDDIIAFVSRVFNCTHLDPEVAVMSLIYIERVTKSGAAFCPETWKRMTLIALMVASKVWDDHAVWNADFLTTFDMLTQDDLNKMECRFLNLVEFTVSVSRADYVEMYTSLSRFSADFPLKPLASAAESRLERTKLYVPEATGVRKLNKRGSEGSLQPMASQGRMVLS